MKNKYSILFLSFILIAHFISAQTNIVCNDSLVASVLKGQYNPNQFLPGNIIIQPALIVQGIIGNVNPDSLHQYLVRLASFHNRNTGSDTISVSTGIGAARRWAYSKFQEFSAANQNRLLPAYIQFDDSICGSNQHRNTFAVLPAIDTSSKSIIIIEAHLDSRCEDNCDTLCLAEGMEDNGSGCALVLELARTMSAYSFHHTIVFLLTIGEEQGLFGATAFASYCTANNILIKSVQNNDIVGGIICGNTSSPPSCPGLDDIDSTAVRVFCQGGYTSPHKAYARFSQLQYREEVLPLATVPMDFQIYAAEDRTGRGGDHIPFRAAGFTAVRYTAENEHGNGNPADSTYTDRQHTHRDILGVDTNGDLLLDSFYVDFNYLARNTVINGVTASMAGIGPETPTFNLVNDTTGLTVVLTSQTQYPQYVVSVRRPPQNYNLDLLYRYNDTLPFRIPNIHLDSIYYISVSSVDTNGIESVFTIEKFAHSLGEGPAAINSLSPKSVGGMWIYPNPFRASTKIIFELNAAQSSDLTLIISDIAGREIDKVLVNGHNGRNELLYTNHSLNPGTYFCTLTSDLGVMKTCRFIVTD